MTQMPPPTGPVAYGTPNPSQSTGLAVGSVICVLYDPNRPRKNTRYPLPLVRPAASV